VQRTLLIFGFWTAYGLYAAWQTHFRSSYSKVPYSWGSALTAELSYAYLWALFTPLIGRICDRWRAELRQWRSTLLVHICSALLFAFVSKLCWDALMVATMHMRIGYYVNGFSLKSVAWSLSNALDIGFTAYFLVAASWYVGDYYARYLQKQREAHELERELARAELRALKMQLNPHFLFNTLHAISALVAAAPKEAEMMIARLSDMLRSSLDSSGQQEVTLEQELRFLQLYLDIEQMRFRDRLRVKIQFDADASTALVPNMLLQPLVENSIRHGIERVSRPGRIDIQARLDCDQLILTVADNGRGLPEASGGVDGFGVGLRATRGRLERLYGARFSLVLRERTEGGVEAVVVLPYQPAPARVEDTEKAGVAVA
jgi:two-component system, LytTR family, sensor kinase